MPGDAVYLELDGRGELYRQLYRALKRGIEARRLRAGQRLPSSRELATQFGLGRNTVLMAYVDTAARPTRP
jgi:GntR family transcriptional regulator/MocR family aminotransferase